MFTIILLQSERGSGGSDCCGVVVVLVLLTLLIRYVARQRQIKEAQAAYEEYKEALRQLKRNPTNADYKEHALHLGRAYCNLSRELKGQGGVTIYDEMALMNDINAACASAPRQSHSYSSPPPSKTAPTIEERLAKLAELRNAGLITDEEYESRRRKILDEI